MKNEKNKDYLWSMSNAPTIDTGVHWFQLLLPAFFSAVIIMITRMATYTRPVEQFYWNNWENTQTDFFSYYKMICVCVCGTLALVFLLYRVFSQSLAIKKTAIYIPMALYSICIIISYITSDFKEFALLGWIDRFEGTAILLCYMIMLFYIINSINTEKAVKSIIYSIAVTSGLLGILGISQAFDKDFFRTTIGQKLIVPNSITESGATAWQLIDQAAEKGEQFLKFTFQNKEIYQTVYNINYVSFYLTLLIPLFGLIFIHSVNQGKVKKLWEKVLWGILFAILLFNIIGSASSGGYLGLSIAVLTALILLNKKILNWWKPVIALLIISILIGGITYERWLPEVKIAINATISSKAVSSTDSAKNSSDEIVPGHLDFFKTEGNTLSVGYNGNKLVVTVFPESGSIQVTDDSGKALPLKEMNIPTFYGVDDERFDTVTVRPAGDNSGNKYAVIGINGHEWPFCMTSKGLKYTTPYGKLVDLDIVPSIGWENNQGFGTGRGYIWSRTLPMMKDTILVGHGADTYCIYFPQKDYVGKYNSPNYSSNVNIIVDKPHNMYMGMWIGTGGISVIAFLSMLVLYFIQSIKLAWKNKFDTFLDFTSAGIFLGILGFSITGLVDDSSVSVMPMFYGLLGTGIAINMIQKRTKACTPN